MIASSSAGVACPILGLAQYTLWQNHDATDLQVSNGGWRPDTLRSMVRLANVMKIGQLLTATSLVSAARQLRCALVGHHVGYLTSRRPGMSAETGNGGGLLPWKAGNHTCRPKRMYDGAGS
jgi:hypothetical protein